MSLSEDLAPLPPPHLKPSERIEEIARIRKQPDEYDWINAIIAYLDEEWENKNWEAKKELEEQLRGLKHI